MDTGNTINLVAALASLAGAGASWAAFAIGRRSHSIEVSSLLLVIESQLNEASRDLTQAIADLQAAEASGDSSRLKVAAAVFATKKESYFNRLDRLSFETLAGRLNDHEMRQQYRHVLRDTIRQYKDVYGPGTSYGATLKLHEKWEKA